MEKRIIGPDGREYCTPACCGGPPAKKPSSEFVVPPLEAALAAWRAAPNVAKLEAAFKAGGFTDLKDHRKVVTDRRTYHWSMAPGRYVNKDTGAVALKKVVKMAELSVTPLPGVSPKTEVVVRQEQEVMEPIMEFTGTMEDWFGTLQELIIQASNDMFRRNLFTANIVETSPFITDNNLFGRGYAKAWEQVSPSSWVASNNLFDRFTLLRTSTHPENRINVKLVSRFKAEFGDIHKEVPELDIVALDQPALLADYEIIVLDMPVL